MFLRNPGDWTGKEEDLEVRKMLAEVRLMMHGETPPNRILHDVKASWGTSGKEGEYHYLRLKKKQWIRCQIAFQAQLCFYGRLYFDGELLGEGYLAFQEAGIGLEIKGGTINGDGWDGVKEGDLEFILAEDQPVAPRTTRQLISAEGPHGEKIDTRRVPFVKGIAMLMDLLISMNMDENTDEPKGWVSGPFFEPPTAHD
jgi:hypothetical protein